MSCVRGCCADFMDLSERIANYCAPRLDRVWQAVRAFFVAIAQTIADAIRNCFRRPRFTTASTPPEAHPSSPDCNDPTIFNFRVPLARKLDLFKDLPSNGTRFMNKLFDLYMSSYLLPAEREDFNRVFKTMEPDVFILMSFLSVRAIVFCTDLSYRSHPPFLKHQNVVERALGLRARFQQLRTEEQIVILKHIIPSDISELRLPPEGQNLLREIGTLAYALLPGNSAFNQALITVAERLP